MMTPSSGYGTPGAMTPPTTAYDPLMTQFLSNQGMGYMPQSQFMTPTGYGAFRTMPTPDMGMGQAYQQSSLMQNMMIANRGNLFGRTPHYLMQNTYTPSVQQANHITMASRRSADQLMSIGAGIGDMGSSIGVSTAIGTMLGGPLGTVAGLGVGMAVGSVTTPITDRVRQARTLQELSASKIVSGPDMAKSTGRGFTMSAARGIDESIREAAADDTIFKEDDYRKITKLGLEAGMFDYSNSSEQYKGTIKKLTKNFKAMMSVLETSDMKGIAEQMQRMQTMGATQAEFTGIANTEKMFSRMTGLSHKDMVSTYGQQGAMMYSQMGMTNYQGSLENMSNAAQVEQMKRLGLVSASEVARSGGVSGMAQEMTQTTAQARNQALDSMLPGLAGAGGFDKLNSGKLMDFINGKIKVEDLAGDSGGRVSSAEDWASYQSKKPELMKQLNDKAGPMGMKIFDFKMAKNIQRMSGLDDTEEGLTAAYMQYGFSAEQANRESKFMMSDEGRKSMQDQFNQQARMSRLNEQAAEDERFSFRGKASRGIKKFMYENFQQPFASVTDWYSNWSDERENRNLGIVTGGGKKIAGGFSETSAEDFGEIINDLKGSASFNEEMKDLAGAGKYDSYVSNIDRMKFGGEDASKKMYANIDKALRSTGTKQTVEQREAIQSSLSKVSADLGLNDAETKAFNLRSLDRIGSTMDSKKDFTNESMAEKALQEIERVTGKPIKNRADVLRNMAASFADPSSDMQKVKDGILHNAMAGDDKGALRTDMRQMMSSKKLDSATLTYESLKDSKQDAEAGLEDIVDKGGFFGTSSSKESMDVVRSAASKSLNSMDYYNSAMLMSSLQEGEFIDDDEKKKTEEALRTSLKAAGVAEEDIEKYVDGRMKVKDLEDEMKKKEPGVKNVKELLAIATKAGTQTDILGDSALDKSRRINSFKEASAEVTLKGKGIDLKQSFEKEFAGFDGDMEDAFNSREKVQKLLAQTDKGSKMHKILTSVQDMYARKKEGDTTGINTTEVIARNMDILKSDPTSDASDVGMKSKEGNEVVQGMQDALTSVIGNQASATKALVSYLRTNGVKVTTRSSGEGGGGFISKTMDAVGSLF